jgi:ABC-2 type transport system ATP-binding protein
MGRRLVRDIIRGQRERGATVFINSHLLSEIEITCDEVVFIREGEVVTSRDLRTVQETELRVMVRARNLTQNTIDRLSAWSAAPVFENEKVTFTVASRDVLPEILRHLVSSGAEVYEFTPQRMSLEELFVSVMGQDERL